MTKLTKSYRLPEGWTSAKGAEKANRIVSNKINSARERDPIIVELERRHALLPKLPEITVERLEWSLAVLAYLMVRDGPVYAPIFNRLERELAAMREAEESVVRAKRLLEAYSVQPPLLLAPPTAGVSSL
jgi:hypothetical protein